MRARRGDLRAIGLLRKSTHKRPAAAIDFGALETADDLVRAQSMILRAAARGQISAGEAKKLGEQIELLGQALERDQLAKKIRELFNKVGATKQALAHKQIKAQAALLEDKVRGHLRQEEQSWQAFLHEKGTRATEVLILQHILGTLHLLAGMGSSDFIRLGFDNHLPRALQEIFDICLDERRSTYSPKSAAGYRRVVRGGPPERWRADGWSCSCRNTFTLWIKSDLRFSDNIQIYCEACHKLAGWGTLDDFNLAHEAGNAAFADSSETSLMAKLKPAPVMGAQSYLKSKGICAVIVGEDSDSTIGSRSGSNEDAER
jgi:hypothetical protein